MSCVPTLLLSDIPKEASTIPTAIQESQDVTLLSHDLFTNDILYMEVAFDMRPLPAELLPLMPLFCRCLRPLHLSLSLHCGWDMVKPVCSVLLFGLLNLLAV